jgi:hypothetical protein
MNEETHLNNVIKTPMKLERSQRAVASSREKKERSLLIDKLVESGKILQRISCEKETIAGEVRYLGHRIVDTRRTERIEREDRSRLTRRRAELLLRRKRIAAQVVEIKNELSRIKRRLEV